ncbi:MAG: ATP-binding protein, partial [Candidatus Omnitrophota bacterium]
REILDEALKHCYEKYPKCDVSVKASYNCKRGEFLDADKLHMTELLLNLLDNAFQSFVDNKGVISISLDFDKHKNVLKMVIKDDGMGILKKDMPKIFEPFFTTKARGVGLGLTVCKHIVSLHEGTIEIKSEKGKFTVVEISIPIKRLT